MTTEQWERENQDTLMEYFIDGDPSVRRIQCEYCRKFIYTQTLLPQGHLHPDPEPKILQLPDLRSQDAESAEKP